MSDEVLVKVEGVSKKFCRSLKRSLWYGVQDVSAEMFGRKGSHEELRKNEFWAVNDVSFELKRGECLGLIGPNGAGKSTLLKMLNGLVKPDQGRITMRGRVGALIELGAGFNPILTARENIYVNGSVLGFTKKEIDQKFDAIVDFAEIEEFIDTPVQNYSSGMKVRLGFAVAAQMEPDILLIDEVLAVGDANFTFKCINKISQISRSSVVIVVSHSMPMIARMSTKALSLQNARMSYFGSDVNHAIEDYFRIVEMQLLSTEESKFFELQSCKVNDSQISDPREGVQLERQNEFVFSLCFGVKRDFPECFVNVVFLDMSSRPVAQCISRFSGFKICPGETPIKVKMHLKELPLNPGRYMIQVALVEASNKGNLGEILFQNRFVASLSVRSNFVSWAPVQLNADWSHLN